MCVVYVQIYNKLCDFIRTQYWSRGYEEVISPNIFNLDLWVQSGHAQHYKDNMFTFTVRAIHIHIYICMHVVALMIWYAVGGGAGMGHEADELSRTLPHVRT